MAYCCVTLSIGTVSDSKKTDEDAAKEKFKVIIEDGCNVPVDYRRPKVIPEWFDEELFVR